MEFIFIACDDCTQKLLDHIDDLNDWLHSNTSYLLLGKIQPPWGKLQDMKSRYLLSRNKFNQYNQNRININKIINGANLDEAKKKVDQMNEYYERNQSALMSLVSDIQVLKEHTESELMSVDYIKRDLKDIIDTLNKFGKFDVNTSGAISEGKKLLKHMQNYLKELKNMKKHNKVSNKCIDVQNIVSNMDRKHFVKEIASLKNDTETLKDFRRLIEAILKGINDKVLKINENNDEHKIRINELLSKLSIIEEKVTVTENDIDKSKSIISSAARIFNETNKILDNLKSEEEFEMLLTKLQENDEYLSEIVDTLKNNLQNVTRFNKNMQENLTDIIK